MTPAIFRIVLHAADLDRAARFYAELLGNSGVRVAPTRHYFECGGVVLALLDARAEGREPQPLPDFLYFAVGDVDAVHRRAGELGALLGDEVHGEPAGQVTRRPWGERSFYGRDPDGNRFCFVDETTLYRGP